MLDKVRTLFCPGRGDRLIGRAVDVERLYEARGTHWDVEPARDE